MERRDRRGFHSIEISDSVPLPSSWGSTYSLGVGVLAAGNALLAVLLEEVGQASSTKDYNMVSLVLQFSGVDISLTRDGDVKLSAALAKTETLATNGTEDVGEDTNVVLADALALVDLVAARHLGTITTLVHCILDLVVGMRSNAGGRARARQSHGGSSEKEGRDEELHFDRYYEGEKRLKKVGGLRESGRLRRRES